MTVRILGVESNGGNGQTCAAFACMKSAYELAMERLEKQAPSQKKLTDEQKQALAEIDNLYRAKIAEREVFLQAQLQKARAAGNATEYDALQLQLSRELRRLHEECEEKKEKIR
jgi:hypothetical protein